MCQTQTFEVVGMTCGHCVSSVSEEVSALVGVREVNVDLGTGRLDADGRPAHHHRGGASRGRGGRLLARLTPDPRSGGGSTSDPAGARSHVRTTSDPLSRPRARPGPAQRQDSGRKAGPPSLQPITRDQAT